ncbi:TonB-dependent receptor [Rhizorhabdus wittichii]|uniref:TonB-dependent receptor n=1 Tax=Rhizorhabdus wittichii TaxID=160791 RepID=A0A975HEF7_9SPHN|nr:TonB-dependent receptor [Rhizorhabdus wittichii]QTH20759.1 TonB-dependent receptor [Rhizorhabdus wittichii]
MNRISHFARGASALALLCLSAAALAEEAEADRATIIVNAQTVADDARAAVEKRPGGVDVVEASAFADKVAVNLRDALAFSPGVYTQPRFGQEVRLSIRGSGLSRGFHMRGLTLLQDGIPINLADDNGDFQELDPQVFERIEVYRGANALRFGGSTLGGAINAVTPTGRTAPRFELRVDGGSYGTLRTKAAAAFADARGDAYVALTTDRSDGDRDHAKRDAIRFNGNVGLRLTDAIETRFYATISHIDQDLPGSLTLAQALSTPKLSLPANIAMDQERDVDSVRLQNRTTVDLGSGRLSFGGFFNAKKLFHPIFQVLDQKSNDRGVFASLDLAGELGGLPWEATLGTQARFGTVAAKQFVNVAGRRGAPTADQRQTARTINSYGELRLRPIEPLTLIAGGVYTSGERRIVNRLAPARSGEADFDAFAPKLGLLYAPSAAVQLFANVSRSVELPGFNELSQTPNTGLPGFTPVGAQKAWTVEIGTRGRHGIAAWDISFYRADLKGEMLQYAVSPIIPAATFNAGRTRHQGIEAGLDLQLGALIRLRQVYQYNDFRFRDDAVYGGNRLPVIPRHQYRAELRLGFEGLNLTPNVEWVPEGAWADYRNTLRAPGYATIGLGAEARLAPGVTLFLDARNLTGKKAVGDISALVAYAPDNRATPADEGSVAFYPIERRAFYGGLRMTF